MHSLERVSSFLSHVFVTVESGQWDHTATRVEMQWRATALHGGPIYLRGRFLNPHTTCPNFYTHPPFLWCLEIPTRGIHLCSVAEPANLFALRPAVFCL